MTTRNHTLSCSHLHGLPCRTALPCAPLCPPSPAACLLLAAPLSPSSVSHDDAAAAVLSESAVAVARCSLVGVELEGRRMGASESVLALLESEPDIKQCMEQFCCTRPHHTPHSRQQQLPYAALAEAVCSACRCRCFLPRCAVTTRHIDAIHKVFKSGDREVHTATRPSLPALTTRHTSSKQPRSPLAVLSFVRCLSPVTYQPSNHHCSPLAAETTLSRLLRLTFLSSSPLIAAVSVAVFGCSVRAVRSRLLSSTSCS